MEPRERNWDRVLETMAAAVDAAPAPSVNKIEARRSDPWDVLVSTIISLRTRDSVTLESARRLLDEAPSAETLLELDEARIAGLIYPAGMYRTKALNLRRIAAVLVRGHHGKVPRELERLIDLPGVGLKTANLVLGVGFGIPAICVDIHVHRIANRRGWVETPGPNETEAELRRVLPKRWWIPVNRILVSYGQRVCTPVSPRCSICPVIGDCPAVGVEKRR